MLPHENRIIGNVVDLSTTLSTGSRDLPTTPIRLIHRAMQTFHWATRNRLARLRCRVRRCWPAGNGGSRRSRDRGALSQGPGRFGLKRLKGDRYRAGGLVGTSREGTARTGIRFSRKRRPRNRETTWQGVVKQRLAEPRVVKTAETFASRRNHAVGSARATFGRPEHRPAATARRHRERAAKAAPERRAKTAPGQRRHAFSSSPDLHGSRAFGLSQAFGRGARSFGFRADGTGGFGRTRPSPMGSSLR